MTAPHGHTLVELTVVMLVVGVLASFGVPRFVHSLEQSRVDMAATNLRAIWTAQRLYWLVTQDLCPGSEQSVQRPCGRRELPREAGACGPHPTVLRLCSDHRQCYRDRFPGNRNPFSFDLLVGKPVHWLERRRHRFDHGPRRLCLLSHSELSMRQATHSSPRFNPLARGTAEGQAPAACQIRPGYAMAEAILAFAILGIALAGLAPFVVTQLRLTHKLETRFQGVVTRDGQPFPIRQSRCRPITVFPGRTPGCKACSAGRRLRSTAPSRTLRQRR